MTVFQRQAGKEPSAQRVPGPRAPATQPAPGSAPWSGHHPVRQPEGPSRQRRRGRIPLGQILLARGAITTEALGDALARQAGENARLGDILIANGLVSSRDLHAALAERHRTVVVDL